MAIGADYVRTENFVHASGAFIVPRQLFFPTVRVTQAARTFRLTVAKSWYPHYFNERANLEYAGNIPDITHYGVDDMGASERNEFLAWYDGQKDEVFDNKRVLEAYCQDDVSVLQEACRVLRNEFIQAGNIDVFLESVPIALACNKVMGTPFIKPNTIDLIPSGG